VTVGSKRETAIVKPEIQENVIAISLSVSATGTEIHAGQVAWLLRLAEVAEIEIEIETAIRSAKGAMEEIGSENTAVRMITGGRMSPRDVEGVSKVEGVAVDGNKSYLNSRVFMYHVFFSSLFLISCSTRYHLFPCCGTTSGPEWRLSLNLGYPGGLSELCI